MNWRYGFQIECFRKFFGLKNNRRDTTILSLQKNKTMKKSIAFMTVATVLFLTACSGPSSQAEANVDVQVTHKTLQSEVIKSVANLSIEGMTCAAGCGGKIQQELQALKGVKTTDLDFAEGRGHNVVSVEFDPEVISEKEMIQCVHAIADGMYTIKTIEILDYKGLQSGGRSAESGAENSQWGLVFQAIDLVQSVSRFIQ